MSLSCVWMLCAATGSAQIAGEPAVGFEQAEADAGEVLVGLAHQAELRLLAANLPDTRQTFFLPETLLQDALRIVSEAYGIDCATWHGLLLAEGAAPPEQHSLEARLRAAVDPAIHPYLFQGPEVITREEPAPEILEAVRVIVRGESGPEADAALANASYSVGSRELYRLLAWADSTERATVLAKIVPLSIEWAGDGDDCGCAEHLLLERPRRNADEPLETHNMAVVFHGPQYDLFETMLQAEKGLIPLPEYVRRLVERADEAEAPFPEDERLDLPQAAALDGAPLGDVVAELSAASGVPLSLDAGVPATRVTLEAVDVPLPDLLLALGRLAHATLVEYGEGGYQIAQPIVPAEDIAAALPLELWAPSALTTTERDVARQEQVAAAWEALSPAELDMLRQRPVPLASLDPAPRERVAALLWGVLGSAFDVWLASLPQRDGSVPLWLYEIEGESYELRTPGASETIQGPSYLTLRRELTGGTALVILQRPPGR